MRKTYSYVMQENNYDCGNACLQTIFLQLGKKLSKNDLKGIVKSNKQGTTALDLVNTSKKLGLNAKGVKCELKDLTTKYLPCIAHVIKDKSYYHYIVIFEIDFKNKKILIFDPACGLLEKDYEYVNDIKTGIFVVFDKIINKRYKDKRFKNCIKDIFLENKFMFLKTFILSLIFIFLSLIFNYYLKTIISYLEINNYKMVYLIVVVFGFICVFKNIFEYIRNNIIIKLNKKLDKDINNKLISHLIYLPYEYYASETSGNLVSIVGDIENFKNIITKIFVICIVDIVLIFTIILFISFYNLSYLLIFFLLVGIIFVISLKYQTIFNNNYIRLKACKIKNTSCLIEAVTSYISIKGLNIENKIMKKITNNYQDELDEEAIYNKEYNKYDFINNLVLEIFYILIIFISCIMVMNNKVIILDLILFSSLFYLMIGFLNNIMESISMYKTYQTSIDRVLDLIEIKKESFDSSRLKRLNNIEIKNLSFSYDQEEILKDINMKIERCDKIFISGKSGIGKSTIIKLLLKYYEANEGKILFDNININYLDLSYIRRNITYLSQNDTLFTDTIYNNLALVNSNKGKITKAMKTCLIEDMFKEKDITENFFLEENGINLSGGQRKKILIARSLLKAHSIIVFDESFNEIDADEERVILNNIFNNYKDLTIILISHRKNNKDLFNKWYELKDKRIEQKEE